VKTLDVHDKDPNEISSLVEHLLIRMKDQFR